jgi:hypothetical protein
MDWEHWSKIAAIIATLIAPFLKFWSENLAERSAAATPAMKSPKPRMSRAARFFGSGVFRWASFAVGFGLSLTFLISELRSSEPLTRLSVFMIAFSTAAIIAQAVFYFLLDLVAGLVRIQGKFLSSHERMSSTQERIIGVVEGQQEKIIGIEQKKLKAKR